MADIRTAILANGSDFNTSLAELQRGNTEVSLKFVTGTDISNGDLLSVDGTSTTGYTVGGAGTYTTPIATTYNGESVIKYEITPASSGTDSAYTYRTLSSTANVTILTIKMRFAVLDATSGAYDYATNKSCFGFGWQYGDATTGYALDVTSTAVYMKYNNEKVCDYTFSTETDYVFTVAYDKTTKMFSLKINGSTVASSVLSASAHGLGNNNIHSWAYTIGSYAVTAYMDYALYGTDYGYSFPTEAIVSMAQVDSCSNSTVWDMSTFYMATNPNGESGTIKFKYATDDTGNTIPDYADDDTAYSSTWLTLAQLQAESDPTAGVLRIACQITSNGDQDGTITDSNIIASVTVTGGGEYSYTF